MSVLSSRVAALAATGAIAFVVACSGSSTLTSFSEGLDGGPTYNGSSSGSSGSPGDSGTTTTTTSCADPTCPIDICQCNDDTFSGTNGVCRSAGECDNAGACTKACGSAGFSGGTMELKACTGQFDCITSEPNVTCACNEGAGWNANAVCKAGHCSSAPEDVCPAACSDDSGWAGCASAADCAPLICACKDGTNPATASPCSGGKCSTASAECPSLCGSRGGWSGSGGGGNTGTDAGGGGNNGPKPPGSTCSKGSECQAFDCSCKDGSLFKGNAACSSGVCSSQSQVCSLSCLSSGGWSGS